MQQGNGTYRSLPKRLPDHYHLIQSPQIGKKFNEEFGRNSGVYLAKSVNQVLFIGKNWPAAALVLVLNANGSCGE